MPICGGEERACPRNAPPSPWETAPVRMRAIVPRRHSRASPLHNFIPLRLLTVSRDTPLVGAGLPAKDGGYQSIVGKVLPTYGQCGCI